MPKVPSTNLYVPGFTPISFQFGSSPPSEQLNVIQQRVQQDLLTLYRMSKEINDLAGSGSTRVAIDASNFTINNNAVRDFERINTLRRHFAQDGAAYISSPASYTDVTNLRAVTCPMVLGGDWVEAVGDWVVTGGLKKVYQNSFDSNLMGQMTTVSHRLASPSTTITLEAVDSATAGINLIDASLNTDNLFDQNKDTQLVFVVDKDISSESGKASTDSPWEEIAIRITSADLADGYNAVQFEFGLPMTITNFGYGGAFTGASSNDLSTGTAHVDEDGATYTHVKYRNGLGYPLKDITRRTIYTTPRTNTVLNLTLRSSHWIPYNDAGTIKKRFLFPIYGIDCINYAETSTSSYGVIKVPIPMEYAAPSGDGDTTFYSAPTISAIANCGIHIYPPFIRENSQSDVEVMCNVTSATALTAAKNVDGVNTHTVSGAATEFYVRVKLTNGTYIPRIDAIDLVYEIS